MGIFSCSSSSTSNCDDYTAINLANGLTVVLGKYGVNIEGNTFGTDFNQDDIFSFS